MAALTPAIATATTARPSLQACVGAFVARLGTSTTASPKYRLARALEQDFDQRAHSSSDKFTFHLEAHDPRTGTMLARATCSATSDGTVESLRVAPVVPAPMVAMTPGWMRRGAGPAAGQRVVHMFPELVTRSNATPACLLDRRTLDGAVRTKHATIACQRLQHRVAVWAFIKVQACIDRHFLKVRPPAIRAFQQGLENDLRR